jgi:uncharacterized protein with HEPN domain
VSDRDARLALSEMLESIIAIRSYTNGVNKAGFEANTLLQDAVIRRLEVMGEAANQLPELVKSRFPAVEWRVITAMRNRLIHGYFSVDVAIVWNTVEQDLPTLETEIRAILNQLQQNNSGK